MRLVLFDLDRDTRIQFHPLALCRPIWELRCGMTSDDYPFVGKHFNTTCPTTGNSTLPCPGNKPCLGFSHSGLCAHGGQRRFAQACSFRD